jgi:lysyl-tRNA synthetase class II
MFKLTDSLGRKVFECNYEFTNENISVNDEERYTFTICNNRWCLGDVSVELYLNGSMCKKIDIEENKTGYIPFKTGIASEVTVRVYPKYEIPA